ncbi:unnamed protein product [Xylocopa violacea]
MKLWILGKTGLIVVTICTLSLYVLSFYFDLRIYDLLRLRRMGDELRVANATNATKKILFWNTMFGNETFYMGQGDIFQRCPVNDCVAMHERSYADQVEFDAVLFHGNELDVADLPATRSPRQWYVFVNLESPVNRPLTDHFYEDFFNLTMTYRLDSDVVWAYNIVRDARTGRIVAPTRDTNWTAFYNRSDDRAYENGDSALSKLIRGKKRPVAWFVSNCKAKSGRQNYVDELSRHISVDIYGRCGSRTCPVSEDCFARVAEPNYYFYLSFENSLCDDYVTEKLYNALRYNVVPIVYGGANYSLFAPPRSYINALDFDSPHQLADYLKRLINDPREYGRYFVWKRHFKIDSGTRQATCDLCKYLHEHKEPRAYSSLSDWYSRERCPSQEFLRHHDYVTGSVLRRGKD